jgi:starch synthase
VHILFVTSEYAPFAKAGGLADAVTSLAEALAVRGHDLSVVIPKYADLDLDGADIDTYVLSVPFADGVTNASYDSFTRNGVRIHLLEYNDLFDRPGIYGPTPAEAYPDNARRFSFLASAAPAIAAHLDPKPHVIHSHDWPGALVPAFLRSGIHDPAVAEIPTVFSIHNFGHQGEFHGSDAGALRLGPGDVDAFHIRRDGTLNYVRSALRYSERIVTVSPRYALEIQQPRFGFGLHRDVQMRARDVTGILNGIDTRVWDPERDPEITRRYTASSIEHKRDNKRALQREYGLPEEDEVPIIGMVTRLVEQKGIGPLFEPGNSLVYELCTELPIQFVLLGSGERWCEEEIARLDTLLPAFHGVVGYDETLAHMIEAGSDFFLMPSVYEPCGLNQMYSMRYGTVPIVTRTGGLADSVDPDTGFLIEEPSASAIRIAVSRAVETYIHDHDRYREMQRNGMARDFSWGRSASSYESVYESVIENRAARPFSA